MSRSKLVALKVLFHALIRRVDFKGIDETNRTHSRFVTRHTLRSIFHKSNLLSWDQDVAASNSAALLATWHYFSFRHISISKLSSYQKLYYYFPFFKWFFIRARQKKFPDLRKIIIFCKNNEQKNCPPFWSMTWRHTGSDQSTNIYPRDAPSLLHSPYVLVHVYYFEKFTQCT